MEQHQNYTREVIEHQEEALSKIVAKVPHGSLVLDIGCGSGMMGRYLAEHSECVVDGVDIDPQAVELARAKYRKVGVFNLEHDSLLTAFSAEAYDCIVMADVIEHIVHPEQLFEDVKKLLKPDGVLLFSIPNITHLAAGLELVLGKFGYQNSGLLDATHVRFYSRESFVERLAASGIYVEEVDTVKKDIDQTEFAGFKHFPKNWIEEITNFREDALTYQWIMTARLFKSTSIIRRDPPIRGVSQNYLTFNARLYWRSVFESGFMEENSMPGRIAIDESGLNTIVFDFSDNNCRYPLADIRIDPVSDKTNFIFTSAALVSQSHQTLWATREMAQNDLLNAKLVSGPSTQGFAVFPTTSDPQWNLKINASILAEVKPGCKFHLGLNLSADLISSTVVDALDEDRAKTVERSLVTNEILATKESEIIKLKCSNDQKSVLIDALEFEHKRSKTDVDELFSKLNVLAEELQTQKNKAKEYAAQVQSHQSEMEATHVQIGALEMDLKVTKDHLAERGRQLERAEQHYVQTLNTLSWRVTKPLRWLRRKIS